MGAVRLSSVAGVLAALAVAGAGLVLGVDVKDLFVGSAAPGPKYITDSERAIESDPGAGVEHAVILAEEWVWDETAAKGRATLIAYHHRAKILDNEGRDLANVEIPFSIDPMKLAAWWGRTILPDGQVLELDISQLRAQTVVSDASGDERHVVRAALPGVAPGAVIDYGYRFLVEGVNSPPPIFIQSQYPVVRFQFAWTPQQSAEVSARGFRSSYLVRRGEHLPITVDSRWNSITVRGSRLPAVAYEPLMPPEAEVRANAVFYHLFGVDTPDEFWKAVAKKIEFRLSKFYRHGAVKKALEETGAAKGENLQAKLRAIYDWIQANIRNTSVIALRPNSLITGEEIADSSTASDLLDRREGGTEQADELFVHMARMIGVEADLVLVVDRTQHYWSRDLLSLEQFDDTLVAVRGPDEPPDKFQFLDPGSGLPYGEVRWWYTGVKGLRVSEHGGAPIVIPAADPRRNVSDTSVKISFEGDGSSVNAAWSRKCTGQDGYVERRRLLRSSGEERRKALQAMCGSTDQFEVADAQVGDLGKPTAGLQLTCAGERTSPEVAPSADELRLIWNGAWIDAPPGLEAARRAHSVVFPFPRADLTTIDIAAPAGFRADPAPSPVTVDSPFGSYTLRFSNTTDGVQIQRKFALVSLGAKQSDYSTLKQFFDDIRRADGAPVFRRQAGIK